MTSAIDATKPVAGSPTTQSVRDNFATARNEITALQAAGPYLPLAGGTINGSPGSLVIGTPPGSSPSRGTLIANANAAAPVTLLTPGASVPLAVQGADTSGCNINMLAIGGNPNVNLYRANGTLASALSAVTSVQNVGRFSAGGWNGSAFVSPGRIEFDSSEAWSTSAQGTQFTVTTTPNGTTGTIQALLVDNAGNLTMAGGTATKPGGGSWVAPSDPQLKSEVMPYTEGLDALLRLEPIRYAYNGRAGTPDDGRQYVGLDAEAAAAAMPSLVGEMAYQPTAPNEDGEPVPEGAPETYRTVDPSELVFTLINAVRELSDRLAALEAGR